MNDYSCTIIPLPPPGPSAYDPMMTEFLAILVLTFLLAGTVKGVVGLGLPSVSLGVLAALQDLPTAMALLVIPSLATNLWQALHGPHTLAILRRILPFLILATVTVWIGTLALTRVDLNILTMLLGLLLIGYGGLGLCRFRLQITTRREAWTGPLFGAANGVLTGMTGSFAVPGVMFLQGIGLPKDHLVQAMGMLFTLSTLALAVALGSNRMLTPDLAALSLTALAPALAGMALGRKIRSRFSEETFRRVLYAALSLLGAYIIFQSAGNR